MTKKTEYCWSVNGSSFGKWMKTKEEAIQDFYKRHRIFSPRYQKRVWLVKRVELDPEDYDTREDQYCLKRKNGYLFYQRYKWALVNHYRKCKPHVLSFHFRHIDGTMAENWDEPAPVVELPEIKLFGKWSSDDVQVSDISLTDYIAVKEKYAKYLPHSAGRYQVKRFRKSQCPIVERLTCSLMMHGRNNGKKLLTARIVKHAFEIIHLLTGENPLQVLVNAIINSGPREDSTRIGRAGTVRRQAVDVSPLRRVNQAIWLLCTGAREASFRNI
ncbi:small ribosomal subunit protein uS7-like, partial [Saccostrea cucullata]|uniref:small ribosomal subunit protein uS7-like n=1 Tax=Saccostrea cuccullata TaxID=36930 RepID=UPI002ED5B29D